VKREMGKFAVANCDRKKKNFTFCFYRTRWYSYIGYKEEAYQCFELKHVKHQQNTKLREARDILLPKLMNGQIEMKIKSEK
jgi:hypothetical protein